MKIRACYSVIIFFSLPVLCLAQVNNDAPIQQEEPTIVSPEPIVNTTSQAPLKVTTPSGSDIKYPDIANTASDIQRPEGSAGGTDIEPISDRKEHYNIPAIEHGEKLDNAAPRFIEKPKETTTSEYEKVPDNLSLNSTE